MLHDEVMSRNGGTIKGDQVLENSAAADVACVDRRASDRVPFPAELILAWNHDLQSRMRYRVLDAGDGGYRIHSSLPMLEGMTGVIVRLLPGRGAPIGQAVMVVWCNACDEDRGGFEIGLRLF